MKMFLLFATLILLPNYSFGQNADEAEKKKTKMSETKILGLRTTIYKVDDIEKATKWYTKVFETEPYFKEPVSYTHLTLPTILLV